MNRIVEAIIKEAQARGDFDDLPGRGRPIDLSEYFNTPEEVRVAQMLLRNAGLVPVEIELLQEIAALKESLAEMNESGEKATKRRSLEEKRLQFNLLIERRRREH